MTARDGAGSTVTTRAAGVLAADRTRNTNPVNATLQARLAASDGPTHNVWLSFVSDPDIRVSADPRIRRRGVPGGSPERNPHAARQGDWQADPRPSWQRRRGGSVRRAARLSFHRQAVPVLRPDPRRDDSSVVRNVEAEHVECADYAAHVQAGAQDSDVRILERGVCEREGPRDSSRITRWRGQSPTCFKASIPSWNRL